MYEVNRCERTHGCSQSVGCGVNLEYGDVPFVWRIEDAVVTLGPFFGGGVNEQHVPYIILPGGCRRLQCTLCCANLNYEYANSRFHKGKGDARAEKKV